MCAPTTVSVGPIRSQKGRGVRKSKKGTTKGKRKSIKYKKRATKGKRKGSHYKKRKINVNKLMRKILSTK